MKKLYSLIAMALCCCVFNSASAQSEATFYTSMGSFKVMLTDTLTPRTVDSFRSLVAKKFYDGLIFHRVIDNFMIQGGCPLGTGTGGPGYSFPDEFHATLKNVPQALAMANSGPNTNGSQFFINLVTNAHLNNKHTVFGMVTTGFNIVQNIGKVPTNSSDKPLTDVKLDSIRITKFPASVTNTNGKVSGVNIYPNPNNGVFSISLPAEHTVEVVITDISGRIIHKAETEQVDVLKVDMSHQPKGIYLVRMTTGQTTAYGKIMVQ